MIFLNLQTAQLNGEAVTTSRRTVADLAPYWHDQEALAQIDPGTPLYETQAWYPVPDGIEGAVLIGNTTLHPGQVGDEYFMTRGHWHLKPTHGELCITVSGQGAILLMDKERNTWTEPMSPGSTHWISGEHAHRTVNTGTDPLVFLCAWPADCGHDYESIRKEGFSKRLANVADKARLISN